MWSPNVVFNLKNLPTNIAAAHTQMVNKLFPDTKNEEIFIIYVSLHNTSEK